MSNSKQKNVFGEPLELCSKEPLTGWYRDGCCNTDKDDKGFHTVCAKVTDEFLLWAKNAGNDLITPHPEFGFPGLKDGDQWCVCATWFVRAVEAGKGCPIYLKRTNIKTILSFEILSSTEWSQNFKDNFNPNFFIDISNLITKKINALKFYKSEIKKFPHSRSFKGVESLAKLRGISCGCKNAEAFYLVRHIED